MHVLHGQGVQAVNDNPGIGVGIIGLGFMGRTHLTAFQAADGCSVVRVADRRMELLDGLLHDDVSGNIETGGERQQLFDPKEVVAGPDAQELIDDPAVELVSITTPTDSHVPLVQAAIAAGKHVLVEKPVDLSADRIASLAQHAASGQSLVMPAHCMRFWPAWVWMKQKLDSGDLGKVHSATFRRLGQAPGWSSDFYRNPDRCGGALVDLHIHDVDYIQHCFGVPIAVMSSGSLHHVQTTYTVPCGALVTAEGGWMDDPEFPFTMMCTITCEHGTMDFHLGREPELQLTTPDGSTAIIVGEETGYDGEVRALLRAIEAQDSIPPVTLEDAVIDALIIDAEKTSLERGCSVSPKTQSLGRNRSD
jgi:predicted dehydrogenase